MHLLLPDTLSRNALPLRTAAPRLPSPRPGSGPPAPYGQAAAPLRSPPAQFNPGRHPNTPNRRNQRRQPRRREGDHPAASPDQASRRAQQRPHLRLTCPSGPRTEAAATSIATHRRAGQGRTADSPAPRHRLHSPWYCRSKSTSRNGSAEPRRPAEAAGHTISAAPQRPRRHWRRPGADGSNGSEVGRGSH